MYPQKNRQILFEHGDIPLNGGNEFTYTTWEIRRGYFHLIEAVKTLASD
jgi:hypothetical protein